MRLASRILVVGAVAVGPAVVALLGCGVDTEGTLPGLKNEIPNTPGGRVGSVTATGSSSSSTSTSTSTSSGSTVAVTPCDCASQVPLATSACAKCMAPAAVTSCMTQYGNCQNGCSSALQCLNSCNGDSACINGCINADPNYEKLLLCQCNLCASVCQPSPPVACGIDLDGGANG